MPDSSLVNWGPGEFDTFLLQLGNLLSGKEVPLQHVNTLYPKRCVTRGFACPVTCGDGRERYLDILFTRSFPHTLPLVAIRDTSLHLVWPHVESDGVLCLPSAGKSYNGLERIEQTVGVFQEALNLINDANDEAWRTEHFQSEFVAYWSSRVQDRSPVFKTRFAPQQQSGFLPSVATNTTIYVSDSIHSLRDFCERLGVSSVKDKDIAQTFVLCLPAAPTPMTMPKSALDLSGLLRQHATDQLSALEAHIRQSTGNLWVLIQVQQPYGYAYGGILIPKQIHNLYASRSQRQPKGFRPGRAPAKELLNWFFSPQKPVQYLDARQFADSILRSRESLPQKSKDLQECSLAVVGCGSVGSFVANTLAQAGLGKIVLVDNDVLEPENLSRHFLGARDVGKLKALALSSRLIYDRPQLKSAVPIAQSIHHLNQEQWNTLLEVDLVLFATGHTGTEIYAAEMLRRQGFSGTIGHAWLEPFACAAHLLLSPLNQVSRRDKVDDFGDPLDPVTCWDGVDVERKGGGCGGSYQPYGATSLARATAMIAGGVLDALLAQPSRTTEHIVTGASSELQLHGGAWSTYWLSASHNHPENKHLIQPREHWMALASGG